MAFACYEQGRAGKSGRYHEPRASCVWGKGNRKDVQHLGDRNSGVPPDELCDVRFVGHATPLPIQAERELKGIGSAKFTLEQSDQDMVDFTAPTGRHLQPQRPQQTGDGSGPGKDMSCRPSGKVSHAYRR